MKRIGLLLLLVVVLGGSGCANPTYTMINTSTNEAYNCGHSGTSFGLLDIALSAAIASDCKSVYTKQGFTEITTPATLEITTDPAHAVVFSSPYPYAEELAKEMSIAPITRTAEIGNFWLPECYKAVYDGRESDVVCRENVEVSRRVHLIAKHKQMN